MTHRRARWSVVLVAIGIGLSTVIALPAAAEWSLLAGDRAAVVGTDGDGVNVRLYPGYDSDIVSTLPEGFAAAVIDGPFTTADGTTWYAISAETSDGTIDGWVSADYLSDTSVAEWIDETSLGSPDDSDAAAQGALAVVATDGEWLNMRSEPATDAAVIDSLTAGTTVEVLSPVTFDANGNQWTLVRVGEAVGYVVSNHLVTDLDWMRSTASVDTAVTDLTIGAVAVVSGTDGDGLFVRSEPSPDGAAIASLDEGMGGWLSDGPVYDEIGTAWYAIETDVASGWVRADYLTATAASGAGDTIVAAALDYIGVPYVWGGTTPDGFDCSGFTYYILSEVLGYGVERPIEDQLASGSYVDPAALLPGDLIFFQNTYQWGLSHVGFYLGDGQFISATGQFDAVGVSDLSDPYWGSRYLEARRID